MQSEDPLLLPAPLASWCAGLLGTAFVISSRHDHEHGESRVWCLKAQHESGVAAYYLKCHRQVGKWHSEVFAYENWTERAFGKNASTLVGASDDACAVLVTALPGKTMEKTALTDLQEKEAWTAAGVGLARLHGSAANDWFGSCFRDGTPQGAKPPVRSAADFVAEGIESNTARAEVQGALSAEDSRFIRSASRDWTTALTNEQAVPVHRDYSPRNWIVSPENGQWSGVIDFEHCRWDTRAADMQRGWDREFLGRPDLFEAFFAGYLGEPPSEHFIAQIRALRLLHAVGGIRWSVDHGDAAFEAENRATFECLQNEAASH